MQRISHETYLLPNEHPTPHEVTTNWLKTSAVALMLSSVLLLPGVGFAADTQRANTPLDTPTENHKRCGSHHGRPDVPGGFSGFGSTAGLGMMTHGLKLSDTQESQVFNLIHAQAPALHENEQLIRQNHKLLMEMSQARNFDVAKAEALSQATGQAIASNLLIRTRANQEIFQLLTLEQRKTLEESRKHFDSRMRPE